jgi:16S rRNA (uracil1498-N3)-methyltransferase
VIPVVTKLADIRLRDESDTTKRVARWQRIALEAAKQSGRAVVPEVTRPVSVEHLVRNAQSNLQDDNDKPELNCLFFSEREGQSILEAKAALPATPSLITALVGSEGGWTDEELATAREVGWTIVTLGGRTLRAETAAIAVAVLLQHLFGDLA